MIRALSIMVAMSMFAGGIAAAQDTRFSGNYYLSKSRHTTATKPGAVAARRKPPRPYNPKEFKLDEKAPWKAARSPKTLCAPAGAKPRSC